MDAFGPVHRLEFLSILAYGSESIVDHITLNIEKRIIIFIFECEVIFIHFEEFVFTIRRFS
jgi:hypothetical protein